MHEEINYDLIRLFIEKGANINKEFQIAVVNNYTILGYLCKKENTDANFIEFLIKNGADVNIECREGFNVFTPLQYLCQKTTLDIHLIKLLVKSGANVNQELRDSIGNVFTFLSFFCQRKEIDIEMFQFLMESGLNFDETFKDYKGTFYTALCYFCRKEEICEEVIKLIKLIIENGVNINKECQEGFSHCTPLGYLCQHQNISVELIQYFLEHGADINHECRNYLGDIYTPLGYLMKQENVNFDILNLFILHNDIDVNHKCREGFRQCTPLDLYISSRNEYDISILEAFTSKGCNIDSISQQYLKNNCNNISNHVISLFHIK